MDTQSIPSNSSALVDDLFLNEDALEEVEGVAAGEADDGAWRGKVPETAGGRGMVLPSTGMGSFRTPCRSGHRLHSLHTPWAF